MINGNSWSAVFFIIAVGSASALFHGIQLVKSGFWHIVYSDILPFYNFAVAPGVPYIDKLINYPVLTGLFIDFAGYLGGTKAGYYIWTSVLLILLAAGATYFLVYISSGISDKKRIFIYWVFAPSMFFLLIVNWDILAIFFVLAAFYFMTKDMDNYAVLFLALGAASKFFPVLYLAPLLLRQKDKKDVLRIFFIFISASLLINGFFMIENFNGWMYFFTFFGNHWPNPDSIWTLARIIFGYLTTGEINAITGLVFLVSYGVLLWKFRKESMLFLCFGATVLFIVTNKMFSPQYILWLLPFFVLLPFKRWWFYALELSNLAVLFSLLYWRFQSPSGLVFFIMAVFVVMRHAMLVFLAWQVFSNKELRIPLNNKKIPVYCAPERL